MSAPERSLSQEIFVDLFNSTHPASGNPDHDAFLALKDLYGDTMFSAIGNWTIAKFAEKSQAKV